MMNALFLSLMGCLILGATEVRAQTEDPVSSPPVIGTQDDVIAPETVPADAPEDVPAETTDTNPASATIATPTLPATSLPAVPVLGTPMEKEINDQIAYLHPSMNVNGIQSLFFSVWEHDLLIQARRGSNVRPTDAPAATIEGGLREISLSGIVYVSKKDWTIWLNNARVTPTAIPEEVMDLKVFKDYIELDWFDRSGNKVYPIRLRPHQRFNLDARLFLPE